MDRLGRNLDDLRKLVLGLTERVVRVEFRKENLIFARKDPTMANLLLSVMGAIAEFERRLIRERQREGIAIAKNGACITAGQQRATRMLLPLSCKGWRPGRNPRCLRESLGSRG